MHLSPARATRRLPALELPTPVSAQSVAAARMPTGVVKFFNSHRGFGFIVPDVTGPDVFVHISALEDAGLTQLREGQRLQFDVVPAKKGKGPKAINVSLIP